MVTVGEVGEALDGVVDSAMTDATDKGMGEAEETDKGMGEAEECRGMGADKGSSMLLCTQPRPSASRKKTIERGVPSW